MSAASYVQGACVQPLIGATIGLMFDAIAEAHPEREALVVPHQHVRWTYTELQRRVDAIVLGLMRLGLEPGDRLGISLTPIENSAGRIVAGVTSRYVRVE